MKIAPSKLLIPLSMIFLLTPSAIWVLLDNQPFPGDPSVHARDAVRLISTLEQNPSAWSDTMLQAIFFKGPGLAWFGQIFVWIGEMIGAVDDTLLFFAILSQIVGLGMLFYAIHRLSSGRWQIAFIGTLVVASAPLFGCYSHGYWMEPFQIMATSWFCLILSSIRKWSRAYTFAQLTLATTIALLIRASTPIYFVLLGLSTLLFIFREAPQNPSWGWYEPRVLITLSVSAILLIPTSIWYLRNWNSVMVHARLSAWGDAAATWGRHDTLINTFIYWIDEIRLSVFFPWLLLPTIIFFGFGVLCFLRSKNKVSQKGTYFARVAFIALLQILFYLLLFATSKNRLNRFLLPLLPLIGIIFAWSFAQIKNKLVIYVLLGVFLLQFSLTHAINLGFVIPDSYSRLIRGNAPAWRYNPSKSETALLEEIATRTCNPNDSGTFVTIIAIDPGLLGHWLGPVQTEYTSLKLFGVDAPCIFDYAGGNFFGADLQATWADFITRNVRYIVSNDPEIYPDPGNPINRSLLAEVHTTWIGYLRSEGAFEEIQPLATDPGILIFRRIE